jgi:fatty-acyl-CoA synthase
MATPACNPDRPSMLGKEDRDVPESPANPTSLGAPIQIDAAFTLRDQIEARAQHPALANRVFLVHDQRRWTYREYRNESVRVARALRQRLGRVDEQRPGHVAMLLENHMELLSLLGGCAFGGHTLFGINTGLRGETLAGVLNHSRARVLVVDEKLWPEVERVKGQLTHLADEQILVLAPGGQPGASGRDWLTALEREVGPATDAEAPDAKIEPTTNLIIIYTSGTTGLPKGINNNHAKLCFIGGAIARNLGLTPEDTGYANMPLFHSNALFVGLMPAFWAGARMGLRERFSASRFLDDLRQYGCTYWNYVGEPVHYVIGALEKQYGGDETAIIRAIAGDPRIRLRYAVGNGAAAPDIDKLMRYFGLEDMFELYGSTEAAISTFRKKGDPRGSVGEITDPSVKILRPDDGRECPPAELDADGKILNYHDAVGEICRVAPDTALFQGYFENADANSKKYRNGVYHSGDLGHVLLREGQRFLYFDGRGEDWIRKDGENFSAGPIGEILEEHPDVALAVAYGAPSPVSDELVMAAIKLRQGASFDPGEFFRWCEAQAAGGSMDRKWIPDFVRVVQDFQYTETHKVLVRHLKRDHFNRQRLPGEPIYWRCRGDLAFREFHKRDYDELRAEFARRERLLLLEH